MKLPCLNEMYPDADGQRCAAAPLGQVCCMLHRFIVTANVPDDVVAAVQFAADHSLKVSALGGGHQLAGIALPECGVVILMYKLQYLALDPVTNLTTVQASPAAG